MIIDVKALKKWKAIPPDIQVRIIDNVFCATCDVTTIVDYSMTAEKGGLLLTGKCAQCGQSVARFVEFATKCAIIRL